MNAVPHVLMVVTSNSELANTGRQTGLWVEELAAPYRIFLKEGFEVDIASPKGGRPPFDEFSLTEQYVTPAVREFLDDPITASVLDAVIPLEQVSANRYDGVFLVGGFGVMWDLVGDADLLAILSAAAEAGLPIAAVCHAPAVLADVQLPDGTALIRGKSVTGFSDAEEEAVALGVDYARTVEGALRGAGGNYSQTETIFGPHVVSDGRLHTGQNPASSDALAQRLVEDIRR
jgi:putative intracellular protease/amidase